MASSEAKPVGPYETFGACVGAMQNRGYPEESARRICGSMEALGAKRFAQAAALLTAIDALEPLLVATKRRSAAVTRSELRLARRLDREAKVITAVGAAALTPALKRLGDLVADTLLRYVSDNSGGKARKDAGGLDFFASATSDDHLIGQTAFSIEHAIDWTGYGKAWLGRPYERMYQMAGEMTFAAVSDQVGINIGFNLREPAAQRVLAAGGTRRGLVDLRADTRSAVLGTLEEARKEGWGPPDTARRLRDLVPAGRFWRMQQADPPHGNWPGGGVNYRTNLIARTETKYAQNLAAYEAGAAAGFDTFVVFDARLGPTDAECEAINGQIVDGATARRLLEEEHPNGTRSISPVPRDSAVQPIVDVPMSQAQLDAIARGGPAPSLVQQIVARMPDEDRMAAAKEFLTRDEQTAFLANRARLDWAGAMSDEERSALRYYKGAGSGDMNRYEVEGIEALRPYPGAADPTPGTVAHAQARLDALHKAIDTSPPLEHDVLAFRGLSLPRETAHTLRPGAVFSERHTASLSLDINTADGFSRSGPIKNTGVLLRVVVPQGTRAATYGWRALDAESELTVRPLTYRVVRVEPLPSTIASRERIQVDVIAVSEPVAIAPAPPPPTLLAGQPLPPHVARPLAVFEDAHRNDAVETALGVDPSGKVIIDKSQGVVNRVDFTQAEADSMRGGVLTHNHPGGTAFSVDDLAFLRAHDLHEIRVARKGDGNITARLTDKGRGLAPVTFRAEANSASRQVEREFRSKIDAGDLTPQQANALHADRMTDLLVQKGLITVSRTGPLI